MDASSTSGAGLQGLEEGQGEGEGHKILEVICLMVATVLFFYSKPCVTSL